MFPFIGCCFVYSASPANPPLVRRSFACRVEDVRGLSGIGARNVTYMEEVSNEKKETLQPRYIMHI